MSGELLIEAAEQKDLDRILSLNGGTYPCPAMIVMIEAINHGTDHRSQIATLLSQQGIEPPTAPIYFLKSANTISGPNDSIRMPPNSTQVDYEAEFAIVIGKGGKRIPEEKAYEHVAGYMILHDVTARDMQFADKQWYRGKSCDTFAPTGPWIVTRDEVPDPHNLHISLTLNGQTMQDSNTSNLIFKVPYLVSYLSQSATWEVGDVISTGTPPGVGVFRKPQVFMKAGDSVSITVERLGTLANTVVGP